MKEKKEGVIRLEETSKAVIEEVLEYLYTGHIDINENSANFDLIAAADYFVMPSLKALCGRIILKTLALCNCVSIYYFALKYRCEELEKGAKDFILANFAAVADTEDFLNLSSKQVEQWISSDEIIVEGEEEVFEVVVKWVKRNDCQNQNFYELFRHIRCIYLPRVYLSNVALRDPLVKNNSGAPAARRAAKRSPISIPYIEILGNPSMNFLMVIMASGIARGRVRTTMTTTTTTESRKMAAILQVIG